MSAGVAIGLFWEIGHKADDEFVGHFEQFNYFWLIWVFDELDGDTMNEVVEVVDGYGVDSIPLIVFEGCSDDVELG